MQQMRFPQKQQQQIETALIELVHRSIPMHAAIAQVEFDIAHAQTVRIRWPGRACCL
jgi:hypothetical protein